MNRLDGELLMIRADASVAIGTGHVMRCLALAQSWQDVGGQVAFVMANTTPAVATRLQHERVALIPINAGAGSDEDLKQTIALARDRRAAWIVADNYDLGSRYQGELEHAGLRVLWVDDNGTSNPYSADFVLNQNLHAAKALYPDCAPQTRLLLGCEYALLRREFLPLREHHREIPTSARRLLVTMGGSDPDNVTVRVLDALDRAPIGQMETVVVAGGSNPHLAALRERIAACRHDFRLVVDANSMGELMTWADLAISAAGTVCWEYCLAGLPAILLVIAENQLHAARALDAVGAAVSADRGSSLLEKSDLPSLIARLVESASERQSISVRARPLVDGRGTERVLLSLLGTDVA